MNCEHRDKTSSDAASVPDDLRALDALLATLGEVDRAECPVTLGRAAFEASREVFAAPVPLEVRAQADQLDTLGRIERSGAPAGLERGVFEASRSSIGESAPATMRLAGEGRLPAKRAGGVWAWRGTAVRVAAGLCLMTATAAIIMANRGGVQKPERSAAVIAASFDSEMAIFMDLLEDSPATESTDRGTEVDHSWADELLEWESL